MEKSAFEFKLCLKFFSALKEVNKVIESCSRSGWEIKEEGDADSFSWAGKVYNTQQTMGRNHLSTHGDQWNNRGRSRYSPFLPCLLCISVYLYAPRLYISGPLSWAPPILSEITQRGEKYWDRFQLVLFGESYGMEWGHLEIYNSKKWEKLEREWVGQVTAAFSFKPFCIIWISKIICMPYFDWLIKILIFQNK